MTSDYPAFPADQPEPVAPDEPLRIITRGWWLVLGTLILFWPLAFGAGSSFQRARFHAERGNAAESAREYGRTKLYFFISIAAGVLLFIALMALGLAADDPEPEYVYYRP